MATTLTVKATEESTYVVTASFTDEDGTAIIPTEIKWTLTDAIGNVINNREDVVVTPASEINIVLTGDDLAFQSGETGLYTDRIVTVEGKYNSSLGTGLNLKGAALFQIENLTAV